MFSGRNVIKQTWVQPTTHEARNYRTCLNGPDSAFFLLGDVPVVWVWKNHKLDYEVLRQGLQRTLNRIPTAAGRVKSGKNGMMMISTLNSEGCLLELQLAKRMPSEDASTAEWAAFGPTESVIPTEPIEMPLVTATLTHFTESDGCCLFVRISHLLTDGAGVVKFMQTWSWETCQVTMTSTPVPTNRPADLHCDHSLPKEKVKSIKLSKEDLDQRLTLPQVLKFFPLAFVTKAMDDVADFEFRADSMDALKKTFMNQLGKDKWLSSYEAFMGLALHCLAKAEGRSTATARSVVNIRGRSQLFRENYFGVGLSVHDVDEIPITQCAADTAWALHESLRQGLKDMTEMEKVVLIPEHFNACGTSQVFGRILSGRELMVDRSRYLSVWDNCITKDIPVINSWLGYPWFELNFGLEGGLSARPDFMRVPPQFRFRRHIHLSPKSSDFVQLRMQLPKATMARFRQELSASGYPFREVPTKAPSWFSSSVSAISSSDQKMDTTTKMTGVPDDMKRLWLNQGKDLKSFPLNKGTVMAHGPDQQQQQLSMSAVKSRL